MPDIKHRYGASCLFSRFTTNNAFVDLVWCTSLQLKLLVFFKYPHSIVELVSSTDQHVNAVSKTMRETDLSFIICILLFQFWAERYQTIQNFHIRRWQFTALDNSIDHCARSPKQTFFGWKLDNVQSWELIRCLGLTPKLLEWLFCFSQPFQSFPCVLEAWSDDEGRRYLNKIGCSFVVFVRVDNSFPGSNVWVLLCRHSHSIPRILIKNPTFSVQRRKVESEPPIFTLPRLSFARTYLSLDTIQEIDIFIS